MGKWLCGVVIMCDSGGMGLWGGVEGVVGVCVTVRDLFDDGVDVGIAG